jgi:predicted permease
MSERFSTAIDILRSESRAALRRLLRRPSASIVSMLALGCGIGAAAAAWSLMNALLLNPLPVAEPDDLFEVGIRTQQRLSDTFTYRIYPVIRESEAFEGLVGGGYWGVRISDRDSVEAYFASHDFFETLGVPMAIGRGFVAADDERGAPLTVVLSDSYWRQRYAGDPDVVGSRMAVGNDEAVIVGVAAAGFRGLNLDRMPQFYLPLHTVAAATADWAGYVNYFDEPIPPATSSATSWLRLIARLPSGSSAAAASAKLKAELLAVYPQMPAADVDVVLTPINTAAVPAAAREGMRRFVFLLAGTVGLLMLAGCLAAGMLLLVRTESRRDELATARALGASGMRIAAGVAIEGALLALAGAMAALGIAQWLIQGLKQFALPGGVAIDSLDLALSGTGLAAIGAGALLATLMISIIAVSFAASTETARTPSARALATPGDTRYGARSWLVVGQVAAALVLLAGTGLFARSLIAALTLNPGFDTDRIVTGTVPFPTDRTDQLFDELLERLDGIPAIESASFVSLQGGMGVGGQLDVNGVPQRFPAQINFVSVGERYFATMGLGLVDGRLLSPDDFQRPRAGAVVSESLGRLLAATEGRMVGHRMGTGRIGEEIEIVGVVPDIINNVNALEPLVVYRPVSQEDSPGPRLLVLRSAGPDTAPAIREAVAAIRSVDPDVVPGAMLTIDQRLLSQLGTQRFAVQVFATLAAIAVLLTAMCIYVLAESIGLKRRREFGIRAALGAEGSTLAARIFLETLRLVGAGTVIGIALAWAGATIFRTFLFQVAPLDVVTLGTVALAMLVLALLVSLRPAIAAMRVDLARLLRDE